MAAASPRLRGDAGARALCEAVVECQSLEFLELDLRGGHCGGGGLSSFFLFFPEVGIVVQKRGTASLPVQRASVVIVDEDSGELRKLLDEQLPATKKNIKLWGTKP